MTAYCDPRAFKGFHSFVESVRTTAWPASPADITDVLPFWSRLHYQLHFYQFLFKQTVIIVHNILLRLFTSDFMSCFCPVIIMTFTVPPGVHCYQLPTFGGGWRGFGENVRPKFPSTLFFFFFEVERRSRTLIPVFMPRSVHSGSAS